MCSTNQIEEFVQFLGSPNLLLQEQTSEIICGLAANPTVCKSLYENQSLLKTLVRLVGYKFSHVDENVMKTLVNFSAEELASEYLMDPEVKLPSVMITALADPTYKFADYASIVLGNLTRDEKNCIEVLNCLENGDIKLSGLIKIYGDLKYNTHGTSLESVGFILTNFSHCKEGRKLIMDKGCLIEKLMPFINFSISQSRQKAMLLLLRNICLEEEYHEQVLDENVDIVPKLLLPIVSGNGITDEENDLLPDSLQYLDENKEIEQDLELKVALLESINVLVYSTDAGKNKIRGMNILPLLKQFHDNEENVKCKELVMDIIGGLLLNEEELDNDWDQKEAFTPGNPQGWLNVDEKLGYVINTT